MSRLLLLVLAVAACGNGDGGPNFADQHPRIYLAKNRDRLVASLAANGPAAARWRMVTDNWVGGGDVYAFAAWNAALMGQLTGDPKYCAAAVAAVDKVVMAGE